MVLLLALMTGTNKAAEVFHVSSVTLCGMQYVATCEACCDEGTHLGVVGAPAEPSSTLAFLLSCWNFRSCSDEYLVCLADTKSVAFSGSSKLLHSQMHSSVPVCSPVQLRPIEPDKDRPALLVACCCF